MPNRTENHGTCAYCGEVISKRSVSKHLEKCPERLESLQTAADSGRPEETLWHLRVQDAYNKDYWLDLEMTGSASLDKLDKYLRAIWLECCGHLSKFTIGGWGGMDVGKARKADLIFEPGLVLRHLYDFGTTSETDIKVMGFAKARRRPDIRSLWWHATGCLWQIARYATRKRNGCVLNAYMKRTKPAFCAMSMLRNIRTTIMESRCH